MSLLDNASLVLTPNAYKASKLYSVIPSNGNGDFTATRATTATRINSSGLVESVALNVPRVDYSLGGCPNILLEPQRTNLALQSSYFDNASWAKVGVTITANSIASPSGIQDADTITQSGANININQVINIGTAGNYTYSVYIKKGNFDSSNNFRFGVYRGSDLGYITFNFATNTTSVISGTFVSHSSKSVGNGWYLIQYTINIPTTGSANFYNGGTGGNIGAGNFFYSWGAQLEAGAYATSYIPTATASVTRNQDVVIKTGVSSLIGQAQGTLFLEARSFNFLGNGAGERISLTDGTFNNRVNIDLISGNVQMVASNSTTGLYGTITATDVVTANSKFKIAVAYDGANSRLYVNGTAYTTIVGTMPTFSGQLSVVEFNQGNTARPFFGRVEELIVFPTRLTNAQLAQLTTL